MAIKTGQITINARGTRRLYHRYYPKVADWASYYEQRVAVHLGTICSSRTGAALIDALHLPITIAPLIEDPKEVNASASPAVCSDATHQGTALIDCDDDGDDVDDEGTGTGLGSGSTIRFTPGTWTRGDKLQNHKYSPDAPAARPDEILCHELVHAMRHTQGKLDRTRMRDGFGRLDEFQAILVCNIYCSERGRPLRRNHKGHVPMQSEFARDPFRFFAWYSEEVRSFVSDHEQLARHISTVKCPWNPIREHFEYAEVLRQIEIDRRTPKPGYW